MTSRRRFLQIAASAAALPRAASADVQRWRGRAMGAEVELTLYGGTPGTLADARAALRLMERSFSLYDSASELSRLNARGSGRVSAHMSRLLALCDRVHHLTDGLFDPTIQPVFRALAEQRAVDWTSTGWARVQRNGAEVRLGPDQALTLNGIAQGYATDHLRHILARHGLRRALVNVGEFAALGGPFRLALEDPHHGRIDTRSLGNGAMASSSPSAMPLNGHGHILHPRGTGDSFWSTVSVEAPSAALADGMSTALCLAPRAHAMRMVRAAGVTATLVDRDGDVITLRPG